LEDIKVNGVLLSELTIAPFKLPTSINVNFVGGRVPKALEKILLNTLRPKPVFDYNLCVSCGDCKRSCPPGIIDMSSGKPVPDLNKCIRCFCCHELCPKKAVDIKRHWLYDRMFKK
jgi:ferredoxin